jgi:hypothetical protein
MYNYDCVGTYEVDEHSVLPDVRGLDKSMCPSVCAQSPYMWSANLIHPTLPYRSHTDRARNNCIVDARGHDLPTAAAQLGRGWCRVDASCQLIFASASASASASARAYRRSPVDASQMRIVLSKLADTICRPSWLNAAEVIVLMCPVIVCSQSPVAALQTRTVLSQLADIIVLLCSQR